MKILHTADWHLGKKLLETPLIEEQKTILDEIAEIIREKKIDVFVLAGDIFQNYNISDEVLEVFNNFLEKTVLSNPNTTFIITNGNHDPAEKLNYGSKLMKENLKIVSKFDSLDIQPISLNKNNRLYNFYVIPFIRISDFNQKFPEKKVNSFNDFYKTVCQYIPLNRSEYNILVTHSAIKFENYELEKSSEDESYGNIEMVEPEIFQDFHLVLMGHYHKQNKFLENIYYSGSIYKYSQKEEKHTKGVMFYDLENQKTEFIPLTLPRDVVCIQDSYKNIIDNYRSLYARHKEDYVYIILKDLAPIVNVHGNLSQYFSKLVSIEYEQMEKVFGNSKVNLTYEDVKDGNSLNLEYLFEKYLDFAKENQNLEEVLKSANVEKKSLLETFRLIYQKFKERQGS